jgi:hypothetical protein
MEGTQGGRQIPAWIEQYMREQQNLMQQFMAQQQANFNAEVQSL